MALSRARLRSLASRAKKAAQYEQIARARRAAINPNVVLYQSFDGNGMLCNPEAIFRELLAAKDLDHLEHIWTLSDADQGSAAMAEFADHPRVSFVMHGSKAYWSALARAKYLVNNATFPPQFGKREGQVYLNTWHGTPLKAMGYDVPDGGLDTRNIVRNLVSADYLLAPNEDTAEMYLSAYRMRNIYRGRIIAEGTPRIDHQFADERKRRETKTKLRSNGVVLDDDQRLLLYAPTWRGDFYDPTNDIRQLRARIETINAQIDTGRYRLLLKVHQRVYKYAIAHPDLRELLVPNEIPTNEVLAVTDSLITDYSSIFIDFLATGRPVLFFAPDIDDYAGSRGFNLPPDQWPGPVCRDLHRLVERIKHLDTEDAQDPAITHAAAYAAARERYCPREDGKAAARVLDIVFRDRDAGYDVRSDFSDGRTPILIHLGGMLSNGITSSALCLLDNIDHDRYDVSAAFQYSGSGDRRRLAESINPRVRLFPRLGGINGSKLRVKSLVAVKGRAVRRHRAMMRRDRDLLRDEWMRCFGESRFDHVIDFSGYSPFWAKLLASRPSGSFSIWLHNDIRAESENPGRSDYLRASVAGVMSLYREADHLVSVSESLDEINRTRLADSAPADRFTFARNTINYRKVQHLAYGETPGDAPEPGADPVPAGADGLPAVVDVLVARYGMQNVIDEVQRRETLATVLPPEPRVRTFVTVGRLSAEKNHERLIRAFDIIHQEDPNTRLVILGSGPLRGRIAELIKELGLAAAVNLAGHQRNPYAVVANSSCFVLSSDYEGQPMVLLEALILGRPIVSTAFGSVQGILREDTGLIVERSVAALAEGMRAFLRGEVPAPVFDPAAYNREVVEEFYRAIGAA